MKNFEKFCRNSGIDFLKRSKMIIFFGKVVLWSVGVGRAKRARKIDTNFQTNKKTLRSTESTRKLFEILIRLAWHASIIMQVITEPTSTTVQCP